jgi:class 3 adenylate cyclase
MPWNEKQSKERVDNNDFHDFEINVADLAKTMDFSNLGTKDVRRANAVHLYADVPNFHLQVADAGADKSKQKKLLRAASILRKIQTDLLKSSDIVGEEALGRIQLQAARLHALCYKPYNDEAKRARHSVVMGITLNSYVYEVFNDVFLDLPRSFQSAVGVSSGKSLIANLGLRGERERLSLGTPANLAAKVLGLGNTIRITPEVYKLLPKSLMDHFTNCEKQVAGSDVYEAKALQWSTHPDLAKSLEVKWDAAKWKKRTEERRDELPLDKMDVSWAEVLIDVEFLTERNSKRTDAIAIYADLDGFTRYVQEAEQDDKVVSLVRELHMIRREFHTVLDNDYPGIVLQHQGDRVFAILHMPCGDDEKDHEKRCRKALDAAIGVQSSMQHVLRKKLPDRKDLYVVVGLDTGTTLVTRLGSKGKREVICIGPEVDIAEDLQLASKAKQIRISQAIYDTIEREAIKDEFEKDGTSYVATELTFPKIEENEAKKAARAGTLGGKSSHGKVETITTASVQAKPWTNEKSDVA